MGRNATFILSAGLLLASLSACASEQVAARSDDPEALAAPNPAHLLVQGGGDDAAAPLDDAAADAMDGEGAETSEAETSTDGDAADAPQPEAKPVSNVRYYKQLLDRGNATMGDGYRLAYNLWKIASNREDDAKLVLSFEQYRNALRDGGLIDSAWAGSADELLTHEEAAYLFAKAIDLKGGVWWTATGLARYAHREMIDRRIFPSQHGVQYISGPEVYSAFRDCKVYLNNAGG